MTGDALVIILPLAALILAGLSIAGIWYWWTTTHDVEEDTPYPSELEVAPGKKPEPAPYQSDDGELQGSFLDRLRDSFKPVGGGTIQSRPATPATSFPSANLSVPASAALVGDVVEVMRIMRDLADGSLIVEINGQRYRRLTDITDAQVGRRFIGNAQALARFARLGDVDIPEEQEDLPYISDSPVPPSASLPTELPPLPSAPPLQPTAATGGWHEAGAGGSGSGGAGDAETAAKSMPEQIEELLQFRLARTPEMAHRSIHVRPAMDGGVRIEVDGRFYDGVGSVTDAPVREFIQATIREWEARQ